MIDPPTTTPILPRIFARPDYRVLDAGGDLCLPGAIEYQTLHSDGVGEPVLSTSGPLSSAPEETPCAAIVEKYAGGTILRGWLSLPEVRRKRRPQALLEGLLEKVEKGEIDP